MRQLTEDQRRAMVEFFVLADPANTKRGFNTGFAAGLEYQQAKIEALEAFIRGEITRDEMEKVTK